MNRLVYAFRVAARDLRRSRLTVVLVVLVLAAIRYLALDVYFFEDPYVSPRGASAAVVIAAVVFVAVRSALAVRDRSRGRTSALLALNGARPLDLALTRQAEALLIVFASIVLLGVLHVGLTYRASHDDQPLAFALSWSRRALAGRVAILPTIAFIAGAMVAAATSGRTDATAGLRPALGGRRPGRPVRSRDGFLAVALIVGGLLAVAQNTTLTRAAGAVLVVFGAALTGSFLLGALDPLARRQPTTVRLTGRSLARQRHRTAPLVTMMIILLGVAVIETTFNRSGTALAETRAETLSHYRWLDSVPDTLSLNTEEFRYATGGNASPSFAAAIERVLAAWPRSRATTWNHIFDQTASSPTSAVAIDSWDETTGPTSYGPIAGTPEILAALGLSGYQADLDAGRAVVLNPLALRPSTAGRPGTIGLQIAGQGHTDVDAVLVWPDRVISSMPAALLPPTFLEQRGLKATPINAVLITSPEPLTDPIRERLRAIITHARDVPLGNGTTVAFRSEPGRELIFEQGQPVVLGGLTPNLTPRTWYQAQMPSEIHVYDDAARWWTLTALGIGAFIIAAALALATTQRRPDDEHLVLQGARPGVRRRMSALEAVALSCVAGVTAVPTGLLVAYVAIGAANQNRRAYQQAVTLTVPWSTLAIILIALPITAFAAAFLLTPPIRRIHLNGFDDEPR
jgi:putative ABC transport system permease protein